MVPQLSLAQIKEGARQVGQVLAQSGVMDRLVALGMLPVEAIILMKGEQRP